MMKSLRTLFLFVGYATIACTIDSASGVATAEEGGEPNAESRWRAIREASKTAGGRESGITYDTIDFGIVDVSSAPADSNVARSVYGSDRVVSGSPCPAGVDKNVCKVEREHTLEWLRSFWPINPNDGPRPHKGYRVNRERIVLVPKLQERDDGAFLMYFRNGFLLQYVDARIMSVLISGNAVRAMSPEDAYWKFASSGRCHVRPLPLKRTSPSNTWGMLEVVERGRCPVGPVEWFRADDLILFVVEKRRQLPRSHHGLPVSADPSTIIGGIPYNDKREFRRFAKGNREALASEYFQMLKVKPPKRASTDRTLPGPLHGRIDATKPVQTISDPKKIEALRRILKQRRPDNPDIE